jgi:hypothetical protein
VGQKKAAARGEMLSCPLSRISCTEEGGKTGGKGGAQGTGEGSSLFPILCGVCVCVVGREARVLLL